MRLPIIVAAIVLAVLPSLAGADVIYYRIPLINPPLVVALQGRAKVLTSKSVSYRHPTFKDATLILGLDDVRICKTLSPEELFSREFRKAVSANDSKRVMDAADWALNHGLLDQFHEALAKTLELDPEHTRAKQLLKLKELIERPVQITERHSLYMKSIVPIDKMRFESSDHFLLMCDTPDQLEAQHSLPRAQERLRLLELVYRCFLYRFYAHNTDLDVPSEPLMAVLFHSESDFRDYSLKLSPALASAAGFWNSKTNITFFYDHGTTDEYRELRRLAKDLQRQKAFYLRNKDHYPSGVAAKYRQMADLLALLVEIAQENSDIEVVTHEVTHQMAGNTGLFPRDVRVPTWVHEGLATYFEAPKDAAWSGMGAVNDERLRWYRGLQQDRQHSNIDFIVSDQIFATATSSKGALHGYGQAWGLTHFLMNNRFDDLMRYYRRLGEMPPDLVVSPNALTGIFSEVFGQNRDQLDLQWRSYMRSLKSDVEVYVEVARR